MQNLKKTLIYSAISVALIISLTSGYFLLKSYFNDKLPPRTVIAGIDVSLKTEEKARIILEKKVEEFYKKKYEIVIDEKAQKLTPKELGITILVDETIDIVSAINGKEMTFSEMIALPFKKTPNLELLIEINDKILEENIEELFALRESAPKPATFFFDEKYNLQISEEKSGQIYNEDFLINEVKNSAKTLSLLKISLKTKNHTPVITKKILKKQLPLIQEKLNHQLELIDPIYSENWKIKLINYLEWIYFEQKENIGFKSFSEDLIEGNDSSKEETWVSIKIKQEELDKFIDEEISKWLDRPSEDVKIYQDDDDIVVIEGKGRNGLEIQRDQLKKSLELAVENLIKKVPIPVLEMSPSITISEKLQELGIKERIGIGHTSYYGSTTNRLHNINVGSSQFNGKLLAPDEIFSFTSSISVAVSLS